jgi:amino acid transporter
LNTSNSAAAAGAISPQRRKLIISASLLALFLGALDALVMSAAMPTVVADLGGLELFSWVYSAYLLARTVALPIFGKLADISNSGTLFAFFTVAMGVMILRRTDPTRHRPFRTPMVWLIAPLAAAGCVFLFFQLSGYTELMFLGWAVIGLVVYFSYSRKRSHVGRGLVEVHEDDPDAPGLPVPPLPGIRDE